MLDIQEDYPNIEYYSPKLRNDDQIAAELYRLHGASAQGWYYMSKRLRKKYHIEEKFEFIDGRIEPIEKSLHL